jgi:hypothetical protein
MQQNAALTLLHWTEAMQQQGGTTQRTQSCKQCASWRALQLHITAGAHALATTLLLDLQLCRQLMHTACAWLIIKVPN